MNYYFLFHIIENQRDLYLAVASSMVEARVEFIKSKKLNKTANIYITELTVIHEFRGSI